MVILRLLYVLNFVRLKFILMDRMLLELVLRLVSDGWALVEL